MTETPPTRSAKSRLTRTWREDIQASWLCPELSDFIEHMADELNLSDRWQDEEGNFSERIEIRADLKREVYATEDGWIVLDDQLVNDVAVITIQALTNPSADAFAALLLRNVCDYLLAFGGDAISVHLMREAIATGPLHPPIASADLNPISNEHRNDIIKEIETAVRTILTIHEIGHLVGCTRWYPNAEPAIAPAWREELACDALATDLLSVFHENYHVITYHGGDDIDEESGFPIALGLYEFVLNAALLSLEVADVARCLLGGRYKADYHQRCLKFAMHRAGQGAYRLRSLTKHVYIPINAQVAARSVNIFQSQAEALITRLVTHENKAQDVWADVNFPLTESAIWVHQDNLESLFDALCGKLDLVRWHDILLPNGTTPPEDRHYEMPEPRRDRGPILPGQEFRGRLLGRGRGPDLFGAAFCPPRV